MKKLMIAALAVFLPLGAVASTPQEPPDINFQFKVDKAIKKGIASLKGKSIGAHHRIPSGNELILLTYVHAGVKEDDPHFQTLLQEVIDPKLKLEHTYRVVLTAMALEEIERVKYQWRIHQCAQFLADNVNSTGQTRYGQPTIFVEDIPPVATTAKRKDVSTTSKGSSNANRGSGIFARKKKPAFHDPNHKVKPKVRKKIPVKRRREGPGEHDHSNMQYAALGFRACFDAGIIFEKELIESIQQWWHDKQEDVKNRKKEPLLLDPPKRKGAPVRRYRPGGSTQSRPRPGSTAVKISVEVAPQGWGYQNTDRLRGSMTVGAIGAMCIYDYILGKDWRKNKDILEGLQWVNKHFTVTENPLLGSKWHYYYLYGLERCGMLFGTEHIGPHKWYRTGAEYLLKEQDAGGGWNNAVDTCFAILFLKRATRSLDGVATGARRR